MKYDFKINDDNQLVVNVTVEARKKVKNPRVVIHRADVVKAINDNFQAPKNYLLGDCLTNRSVYVDNYDLNRLTGCWLFELIQKQPAPRQTRRKSARSKVQKS
tara:strand:+ start:1388 stop:1696 length:309 start_codon:yes stop_codon:yes gene_type:complete